MQLAAPFSSADAPSSASASPRAPSPRGARAAQPPALALPPAPGASSASDATAAAAAGEADAAEAAGAAATPSPQSLEMENAHLRAELAAQVLSHYRFLCAHPVGHSSDHAAGMQGLFSVCLVWSFLLHCSTKVEQQDIIDTTVCMTISDLAAQVALACLAEQERLGGDNAPPRQRAASRCAIKLHSTRHISWQQCSLAEALHLL